MNITHEVGNVGELRVAYEAARRGYTISIPFGHDAKYDLVVDRGGILQRVQVKTVTSDGKVIKVHTRSPGRVDGKVNINKYTSADIEWIVVVDLTSDVCLFVPASELGSTGKDAMSFRITLPKNNQRKNVRFVEDYLTW